MMSFQNQREAACTKPFPLPSSVQFHTYSSNATWPSGGTSQLVSPACPFHPYQETLAPSMFIREYRQNR